MGLGAASVWVQKGAWGLGLWVALWAQHVVVKLSQELRDVLISCLRQQSRGGAAQLCTAQCVVSSKLAALLS